MGSEQPGGMITGTLPGPITISGLDGEGGWEEEIRAVWGGVRMGSHCRSGEEEFAAEDSPENVSNLNKHA